MPRPPRSLLTVLLALAPLALAGCDDEATADPASDAGPDAAIEAVATWHADLKPIIDQRCNGCHVAGGAAPFALDTYEAMRPMAPAALAAIEAGRMPPWMPDPDCRHYLDERLMPASEVELLRAWIAAGSPEGDPATAPPSMPAPGPEFEPTVIAAPVEAYTPRAELADDYRCFILDADFARDTFLTASRVVPDAGALVHHVLVYAMEPEVVESLRAADAAEEGPGYTCFGGPFPTTDERDPLASANAGAGTATAGGLPTQLGSWVPGSVPSVYPEGQAVPIKAGSKVVMQVHYNLLSADSEPDATVFEMRLTETPPAYLVSTKPLVIRSLDIPAGEAWAENVRTYRNYSDRAIVLGGVAGHMHTLGSRLTATIERVGGAEECLLDIPRWDFNWQQGYLLPEQVRIEPGDAIRLFCAYDNSAENQAFVDGVQREPVDVTWGEGTYDEMCMLYMTIVTPYAPPQDTGCGAATACLERCAADGIGTAECLMACPMNIGCKICTLRESANCGGIRCAGDLVALRNDPCLETCVINTMMLGGDTSACMREQCGEMYDSAIACLDPVLAADACRAPLADTCGIVAPE